MIDIAELAAPEPYTAASGTQYTIHHLSRNGVELWTHRDARGYGPSYDYEWTQHQTRIAAIAELEITDRIEQHRPTDELTRAEYEAACSAAGVEALADDDIRTNYGVSFGEFCRPEYDADYIITMSLARARQMTLKNEAARARRNRQPVADPHIHCPNCSAWVLPSNLMSASLGTACPDCYDSLSDV